MAMRTVNIAELKDRLSHYLRLARAGETVLVKDRDRVVARLEPAGDAAGAGDDASQLQSLEEQGILRRGKGGLKPSLFSARPHVKADLVQALLDDREQGH